jgi:O-antigen/teichoic acid export membrane protein
MSVARTVAKNTGVLVILEVLTRITGMLLTIVIARSLGVADYGLFTFAFSFGGLFSMLAMFGLDKLITREVARDYEKTDVYLGRVIIAQGTLSTIAMALMVIILLILGYQPARLLIVAVAGATMLVESFIHLTACFFRAYQRMEYEALIRTVLRILNVCISLTVLWLGYGLMVLVVAQFFVFTTAFIISMFTVYSKVSRPAFDLHWQSFQALFKASLPFALSILFISIYERSGIILLSFLRGDKVTGWYSGASTFVRIFDFIPISLEGALLPAMAQFARSSRKTWHSAYCHSMKYLLVAALPIAIGVTIHSSQFVNLLLGGQYRQSAGILAVVIWVLVISFMNHGASNALISIDKEKVYLKIVGCGAAFNIAANWIMIPLLGPYGVAIAKVLTECIVLTGQFYALSLAAHQIELEFMVKPLVSGLVLAIVLYLSREMNLLLVFTLGTAVYILALLASHTFEKNEIIFVSDFVQSGLSRLGFRRRTV